MRTGMDRRTILRSHQLEFAQPAVQELFWRRYNQATWRRRLPASLQELLDLVTGDARLQPAEPLDEATDAWRQVLPDEFKNSARVEGLSGGRLRVVVDSAATRFVLSRQLGQALIDGLNARIGSEAVRRIDYRIGFEREKKGKPTVPRDGPRK